MKNFFTTEELTAADKIIRAKFKLSKEQPFFSYIIEHLVLQESTIYKTLGVDNKGRLWYNPDFIDTLSKEEIKGVLAHEAFHVAMEHITRQRHRNLKVGKYTLWNFAIDIVTNHILVENNFTLPEGTLIPVSGTISFGKIQINNIGDKSAEEIYDELKNKLPKNNNNSTGNGDSSSDGEGGGNGDNNNTDDNINGDEFVGFDEHIKSDDEKESTIKGIEKDWKKVVAEAMNYSKMQGTAPSGIERAFNELHKHKINWRAHLRRIVSSKLPYDMTYSRPNKKYLNQDIFMPSVIGETIKVIWAIDTSGSISSQDLSDCISEMIGISKSFSAVDFYVLTHDVEVHDFIKIANGNINKIKNIQLRGGGGTSHIPLYKYIIENSSKLTRETKLLISFTDGYSDFPDKKPPVDTIFLLSTDHVDTEQLPKWGAVLTLN